MLKVLANIFFYEVQPKIAPQAGTTLKLGKSIVQGGT